MEAVASGVAAPAEARGPVATAAAVRTEHVAHFWPKVVEWLRRALAEAVQHELNIQDVYRRCLSGESLMVLLALGDDLTGVAVLDYSVDPAGDGYVLVYACGGERMPLWIGELVNTCRAIAQERGARRVLMVGRKGWQPFLEAQGARLRCICMSLEV